MKKNEKKSIKSVYYEFIFWIFKKMQKKIKNKKCKNAKKNKKCKYAKI